MLTKNLSKKNIKNELLEDKIVEEGWTFLSFHEKPRKRIDFIFYNGENIFINDCNTVDNSGYAFQYKDITLHPSDHKAVICDFKIEIDLLH